MIAAAALPAMAVAISAASAVAGTASAIYGAYQQGQQQKSQAQLAQNQAIAQAQAAEYNAQVQRNNAIAQQQASRLQEEQFFKEAQLKRRQAGRQMESARANLLKSGVTESGTGLDLYMDMATENALDAQNTEYKGIIERWNSKVNWNRTISGSVLSDYEASSARSAASFYGSAAKRASSSMGLNMAIAGVGAGLQGAASTYGSYNQMYPSQISSYAAPNFKGY